VLAEVGRCGCCTDLVCQNGQLVVNPLADWQPIGTMRQVQLHLSEHRGVSNNFLDYHILESKRTHTSIGTANYKHSVGLTLSNNDSGTSQKGQLELKDSGKKNNRLGFERRANRP